MDSRKRILTTLEHKEPDRVPFDLGGTNVTGINIKAYKSLRQYLGLPPLQPIIWDTTQQLAKVDDDILEKFGVDVRNISPSPGRNFHQEIKDTEDKQYTYYYDEFGIGRRIAAQTVYHQKACQSYIDLPVIPNIK